MGNGMVKILPGVYLGSAADAKAPKQLRDNEITHILSILHGFKGKEENIEYKTIEANDIPGQDLSQFFEETTFYIHKARANGGNILIHCFAGISRSTTVAIAYILAMTDLDWETALYCIRAVRDCVNPNQGFRNQLVAFSEEKAAILGKKVKAKYPFIEFNDKAYLLECILNKEDKHPSDVFVLYRHKYPMTPEYLDILEKYRLTLDDCEDRTRTKQLEHTVNQEIEEAEKTKPETEEEETGSQSKTQWTTISSNKLNESSTPLIEESK